MVIILNREANVKYMTAVNTLEFSFEDFENLEDTELNETMSFNKLTTFLRYHFSFSSEKLM